MRKIHLIQYAVKHQYFRLLILSMVLPALLVGGCLYYLILMLLAENLGIPESIFGHLVPVVRQINHILLFGLPAMIVALIGWGVVLTTKMIGPIARVEKELIKIAKGDYSGRLKIRSGDILKPIADEINILLDKVEELQKGGGW